MTWNIQGNEKQEPTTKATLPARLSLKIEGEIKSFLDKKKLKEFVNTKPILQQVLKG